MLSTRISINSVSPLSPQISPQSSFHSRKRLSIQKQHDYVMIIENNHFDTTSAETTRTIAIDNPTVTGIRSSISSSGSQHSTSSSTISDCYSSASSKNSTSCTIVSQSTRHSQSQLNIPEDTTASQGRRSLFFRSCICGGSGDFDDTDGESDDRTMRCLPKRKSRARKKKIRPTISRPVHFIQIGPLGIESALILQKHLSIYDQVQQTPEELFPNFEGRTSPDSQEPSFMDEYRRSFAADDSVHSTCSSKLRHRSRTLMNTLYTTGNDFKDNTSDKDSFEDNISTDDTVTYIVCHINPNTARNHLGRHQTI